MHKMWFYYEAWKNSQYIDDCVFRCRGNFPKHDIKVNICTKSIFENIKMDINTIYYLIYKCFLDNCSLETSCDRIGTFCNILGSIKTNKTNYYRILKNKLKIFYHTLCKKEALGLEPSENGKSRIEIDESKIIGNSNNIIWIFGIIDRSNKDASIFCVISDRTKEKLLLIIWDNVYTNDEEDESRTRIYSDYFASYQTNDFENMGFKLNKVNRSVWLGAGHFHTNNIEGLWGQIKRILNNFLGLNFTILANVENEGIKSEDYINDWLCYYLFFPDLKRKKFGDFDKFKYLNDILKIY